MAKKLIASILIWRFALFLWAVLVQNSTTFSNSFPLVEALRRTHLPQWVWSWANFDGVHYLHIAKHGYNIDFIQAFFPVYPLVIRIVSRLFADKEIIVSGLTVSLLLFTGGVLLFYQLLKRDYPARVINQTIFFLLLFPTSFYFASLYTESLFFFLVMATFLMARKRKWWLASICAALASATRISGVLLTLALTWEWYSTRTTRKQSPIQMIRRSPQKIFSVLKTPIPYIAPLGLVTYMSYLTLVFHKPLYFWQAQLAFGVEKSFGIVLLPQVIWRYLKIFSSLPSTVPQFWVAFWEITALITCIFLLTIAYRQKVRRSYIIFSAGVLFLPSATGTLTGFPRYILLAFPMYIVLGSIKNRSLRLSLQIASLLLLLGLMSRFLQGAWVA